MNVSSYLAILSINVKLSRTAEQKQITSVWIAFNNIEQDLKNDLKSLEQLNLN